MKTTRELAKEETQKEIVNNLQELLVKNYEFYGKVPQNLEGYYFRNEWKRR